MPAHVIVAVTVSYADPGGRLLQSANAPDAPSVVSELEETDALDTGLTPGGEIVAEEITVQVIPQAADEFTCYSCLLVKHRSQLARDKDDHSYCTECES